MEEGDDGKDEATTDPSLTEDETEEADSGEADSATTLAPAIEGEETVTTVKPDEEDVVDEQTTTAPVEEVDEQVTTQAPETDAEDAEEDSQTTLAPEEEEVVATTVAPVDEAEKEVEAATTVAPEVDEVITTESAAGQDVDETAETTIAPTDDKEDEDKKKFCIEKGMIIQNGDDVPNKDPCKLCQCIDGEVTCATEICPDAPKGDCSPVEVEGECCPKYECFDQLYDDDSAGEFVRVTTIASASVSENVEQTTVQVLDIDVDEDQKQVGTEEEQTEEKVDGQMAQVADAEKDVEMTTVPAMESGDEAEGQVDVDEKIVEMTTVSVESGDVTEVEQEEGIVEKDDEMDKATTVAPEVTNLDDEILDDESVPVTGVDVPADAAEASASTAEETTDEEGSETTTVRIDKVPVAVDEATEDETGVEGEQTNVIEKVQDGEKEQVSEEATEVDEAEDTSAEVDSAAEETDVPSESVQQAAEAAAQTGEVEEVVPTTVAPAVMEGSDEEYPEMIIDGQTTSTTASSTSTTESTTTSTESSTTTISSSSTTEVTTEVLNAEALVGTASSDILDGDYEYDHSSAEYDQISLDSLGPGACLFDGKVYVSAQQIPRDNPCDFCFCFRGDIICLQQTCPPPIPGCREEVIPGFCCPRYECPVKMGMMNVTEHHQASVPSLASWLFGSSEPEEEEVTTQITGCEIQGNFYEVGAVVESASGPCLQCK